MNDLKKELRKRLPIRVQSIRDRAEENDLDFIKIAEKISSFKTVESFQSWKNDIENEELAYTIERVGGNNYRYLRDMLGFVKDTWALY